MTLAPEESRKAALSTLHTVICPKSDGGRSLAGRMVRGYYIADDASRRNSIR